MLSGLFDMEITAFIDVQVAREKLVEQLNLDL